MVGKSRVYWDTEEQMTKIDFEGHKHRLDFVGKGVKYSGTCNAYDSYCKQQYWVGLVEREKTENYSFVCRSCCRFSSYYGHHLLCGPLPSTIKDQCHIHDLTLVDNIPVFESDFDDEFYCDVCEEERDPRIRVYCCDDCKFIAHVHCVISTVKEVLTRRPERDVRLKVANEPTISVPNCLHLVERPEYEGDAPASPERVIYNIDDYTDDQFERELVILYSDWQGDQYSMYWNDYKMMMSRIKDSYNKDRHPNPNYWGEDEKMVKVGNYKVPWILAPILQMLLARFNDLHTLKFGEDLTSYCYSILSALIHSMNKTRVRYMNEDHLRDWCSQAMWLKSCCFKIDFVFECLRRLSCAYFKLRLQNEVPKMLKGKIEQVKHKIASLEETISETKQEKVKLEAELERVKNISWDPSSAKSGFISLCVKEASLLEGKSAGEDLIK